MDNTSINRRRTLRKNQTDAERKLWNLIRNRQLLGAKFRRQFSIDRYILDFYSPEYKLGIEVDGGQHYEDKGARYDELRTRNLAKYGVNIIRFSDLDVLKNIEGVYEVIQKTMEEKIQTAPHPNPLPASRGEGILGSNSVSASRGEGILGNNNYSNYSNLVRIARLEK